MKDMTATAVPLALPNIVTRVFDTPLMIQPDKLRSIITVLEPKLFGGAAAGGNASYYSDDGTGRARHYEVIDGVAVMTIDGTLVNRGANLRAQSGMTGYEALLADFRQIMSDSMAAGVLLRIDSCGGEVAGLWPLVDEIAANSARAGGKPVWAVADASAFSAAYAIASAADRIFLLSEAHVGSIGVIWSRLDASKHLEQEGLAFDMLFKGARKAEGHFSLPLSDAMRSEIEGRLDKLYGEFVGRVARFRPSLNDAAVIATEAATYMGEDAVAVGLADEIGTFEDVLEMLAAELNPPVAEPRVALSAAAKRRKEKAMKKGTKLGLSGGDQEAIAANEASDDAEEAAAVDSAAEEDEDAGAEDDEDEGSANKRKADAVEDEDDEDAQGESSATGERARIAAILGSNEAKDRPALARHFALQTSMSAKDAVAALGAAAKETGGGLNAAMSEVDNPDIGPGADAGSEDEATKLAASILNAGASLRSA